MQQFKNQAAGLSAIASAKAIKVVAVTSGKGGVGKSHVAVNLAVALAQRDRSTMLLDADLGLANVDVLLGLNPRATLEHVIRGELALEDIVLSGPAGVQIVPGASGVSQFVSLSTRQQFGLISAFSSLPLSVEVMIVDTAPGIEASVIGFCAAAHEVIVVICDEPASMTDAYAMIKVLAQERCVRQFQILCNRVKDAAHGRTLYSQFLAVCDRFLDVSLSHFGSVPEDEALRKCTRVQKAVVDALPSSPSARAFKELAGRADRWAVSESASGRPVFFLERMLAAARAEPAAGGN